jgi:uncharacterized pyridoxamine 5'-phosphate oxidase family protein
MDKVVEYLKSCGTFFYASCDGDKPRVRPFGFTMVIDGKLYFGMGKQKESFKQTVENPNFEICALNKQNAWIRIRGLAVLDDTKATLDKAFEVSPFLKNLYNEKTGNSLGIFYIKDGYAEIADMKGSFEKMNF